MVNNYNMYFKIKVFEIKHSVIKSSFNEFMRVKRRHNINFILIGTRTRSAFCETGYKAINNGILTPKA